MASLGQSVLIILKIWIIYASAGDIISPRKVAKRTNNDRSNEYKVKKMLLRRYDKTTRPVRNDSTPVKVQLAISLYHILDTNEKEQTFTCLIAIRQKWKDEYLTWNKQEYGGLETIRVPANQLWTPDLVISNFAGDKFNDYMITNAIISSDGSVLWLFPALIKTYCTLNVKYFPFDYQHCEIVFISWTHSGEQVDILYNETTFPTSIYYKDANQEWSVSKITSERHEKKYACCEELYPDVTFTINMKRGSLFYIINLIAPCFLIFLISFLGFFLPVESGEKVNLETTILLALVVFLLMVGETMPPTPDAIPILGMFFGSTMLMVTIALVMAVITTNIYAKKDGFTRCPIWIVNLASRVYPSHILPPDHDRDVLRMTLQTEHRKHSCNGGRHGDIMSITDGEAESLTCGCCCHCQKDLHGGSNHVYPPMPPGFDYERSEAEWKMVAKFSDRMLFWVYLALSGAVQGILFTHMVPDSSGEDF